MNSRILISILILIIIAINFNYNSNKVNAEAVTPVYEIETIEAIQPDAQTNPADSSKSLTEDKTFNTEILKFQLADPKDIKVPEKNIDKHLTETKENNAKLKLAPGNDNNKHTSKKEPDTIEPDNDKKEIKTKHIDNKKHNTNNHELTDNKEKEPDNKIDKEIKEPINNTKKTEDKDITDPKDNKDKIDKKVDLLNFTKEDIKKSLDNAATDKPNNQTPKTENIVESDKDVDSNKSENNGEDTDDSIDYYLKKYDSTLIGEANVNEFKHSLVEPFKQSLFYDVLKENKYENIELLTRDITSDFKPDAVVSYNVPLGAQGDFACQLMVLTPSDAGLSKLWVSELIPGEIDSVMIQDVNNDAQLDIISVSTTGGVSLLKSIRVYSYDKATNSFDTIFAMNNIMEGIVNVMPGKILISETFPGGINRAALYVWNGERFERLEL
ncbi:MAG: hypothetical protein AB1782_07880 [Cyanobacteriota bacterium]